MEHQSETSKCRDRLAQYCTGAGLDIGFGGDPITPSAITLDLPRPYTQVGGHPQNLHGHANHLPWFANGALDYIFSSHLLEDFSYNDQAAILREWLRVLRRRGKIVLYQPDEIIYRAHCAETGQPYNQAHKEGDYSLATFQSRVLSMGGLLAHCKVIHSIPKCETYSWEIVLQKL